MSTCSVIIPVKNGERFVGEAIDSLLRQSAVPDEIIVIDDGSTDTTAEILDRYNDAITAYRTSGVGASAARNIGIRKATGEFIAFLDCDDIAHPERLEKQKTILDTHQASAMVFCAMSYIDSNAKFTGDVIRCPEFTPKGFLGKLFERNQIGSTSATMLRRDILLNVGGFDEDLSFNEEYDLWLRIGTQWAIAYIDEPLLFYRLHSENISRNRKGQRLNELKALKKHSTKTIYQALRATYPNQENAKFAFARVLFRMEKLDEAQTLFNELITDGYNDPLLYFFLGNIHILDSRLHDAELAYEKCLSFSPDNAAAYNNLGVVFSRHHHYAKALSAFEHAATLKKHYADPAHNITCLDNGTHGEMRCTWAPLRAILKPVD